MPSNPFFDDIQSFYTPNPPAQASNFLLSDVKSISGGDQTPSEGYSKEIDKFADKSELIGGLKKQLGLVQPREQNEQTVKHQIDSIPPVTKEQSTRLMRAAEEERAAEQKEKEKIGGGGGMGTGPVRIHGTLTIKMDGQGELEAEGGVPINE